MLILWRRKARQPKAEDFIDALYQEAEDHANAKYEDIVENGIVIGEGEDTRRIPMDEEMRVRWRLNMSKNEYVSRESREYFLAKLMEHEINVDDLEETEVYIKPSRTKSFFAGMFSGGSKSWALKNSYKYKSYKIKPSKIKQSKQIKSTWRIPSNKLTYTGITRTRVKIGGTTTTRTRNRFTHKHSITKSYKTAGNSVTTVNVKTGKKTVRHYNPTPKSSKARYPKVRKASFAYKKPRRK